MVIVMLKSKVRQKRNTLNNMSPFAILRVFVKQARLNAFRKLGAEGSDASLGSATSETIGWVALASATRASGETNADTSSPSASSLGFGLVIP